MPVSVWPTALVISVSAARMAAAATQTGLQPGRNAKGRRRAASAITSVSSLRRAPRRDT